MISYRMTGALVTRPTAETLVVGCSWRVADGSAHAHRSGLREPGIGTCGPCRHTRIETAHHDDGGR
jgi:hypothetical protein